MTLRECIDIVDKMKPNQYSTEDKVRWVSEVEHSIITDILMTHRIPLCVKKDIWDFQKYTMDDLDKMLVAKFPYDNIYPAFVKMKIDEENQETQRYNTSALMFNAYLDDYAKHINRKYVHVGRNAYHIY